MELGNVFRWQINFSRDIRPGDQFYILYQDNYIKDKKTSTGHILAAKFINQNKIYTAVRYTLPDGSAHYYTPGGESLERAFLRVPLHYSRVSSAFNLRRHHPLLNKILPHKGVDLAAPRGARIHATANGIVKFVGKNGGYGKLVVIEHNNGLKTYYGHMMRFAKGIRSGKKVQKGDVIGYVGSSGLATGPHVHYEVRKLNRPYDPLKIKLPFGKKLSKKMRGDFNYVARNLLGQLNLYQGALAANPLTG